MLDQARDRTRHATALSPDEARCHRILALILLYQSDFDAAAQHFARALELNPYDADTSAQTGFFEAIRGHGETGLALLDQAIHLNPMHPAWYYFHRGEALFVLGRYPEAVFAFSCLPRKSGWYWARLAACSAVRSGRTTAGAWLERAGDRRRSSLRACRGSGTSKVRPRTCRLGR
ncbi:tetratricopeptide repeat protein [Mesorhizobium sp. M0047]